MGEYNKTIFKIEFIMPKKTKSKLKLQLKLCHHRRKIQDIFQDVYPKQILFMCYLNSCLCNYSFEAVKNSVIFNAPITNYL